MREKRSLRNKDYGNPPQDALLKSLRDMPADRFHELAAMGTELARQDAEQNLRVRTERVQRANKAEASNTRTPFFMMEGFTPALEPKPGSMLLLTDDGSWVPISPNEVLADERSPEVSEQKFHAVVAALDCAMPDNPQRETLPDPPSKSPADPATETRLSEAASIYLKVEEKPFSLTDSECAKIRAKFASR